MNTIKISAVLTAALLTGALSATAFAAETLTTTTGSITFRKAIDVTNAAGAGGITGTIAFDVTAADESDLPDDVGALLDYACLLYTSDAADDSLRVDLGGRRIIKKKFFQAEDGIRDRSPSRGLGDVYKRQGFNVLFPVK